MIGRIAKMTRAVLIAALVGLGISGLQAAEAEQTNQTEAVEVKAQERPVVAYVVSPELAEIRAYTSLKEAIAAVRAGDIVNVVAGVYPGFQVKVEGVTVVRCEGTEGEVIIEGLAENCTLIGCIQRSNIHSNIIKATQSAIVKR